VVYVNRGGLSTKERAAVNIVGDSRSEIESKLLKELMADQPSKRTELKGDEGLRRAQALLAALKDEQKGGTRADYEADVIHATEGILFGGWNGAQAVPAVGAAISEPAGTVHELIDATQENAPPEKEKGLAKELKAKKGKKEKAKAEKECARGKQQRLE
jgi:hypothetical protein